MRQEDLNDLRAKHPSHELQAQSPKKTWKCPNCEAIAKEKGVVSECENCGHSWLNVTA